MNQPINTPMKKRIYRALLVFSIIGAAVACMLTFSVSIRQSMQLAEQTICDRTEIVCMAYDHIPQESYVHILKDIPDEIRATWMAPDGTVLFDSDTDARTMENHGNRPEMQQALQQGTGEMRRDSETMHASAYYYAMRLSDGSVIRLSRQYFSMHGAAMDAVPGVVIVLAVLVILALILSRGLTMWMVQPVEEAAKAIRQKERDEDTSDEFTPFVSHIRAQDRKIHDQKQLLRQERVILGTITNSMREGLVLLSTDVNVVSINPSAIAMLNGRALCPADVIGFHYHVINSTGELDECVQAALHGASRDAAFSIAGNVYHIYASPACMGEAVTGAVIICLDETEQRMAERSRREFSANVSHELKTPLTSISGYAEMMENGMVAREDIRRFSGIIHKEALRLLALIEDIIRLSRIEETAGKTTDAEPVDLNDLTCEVLESLAPVAQKTGVRLHADGEVPAVPGERSMLGEMICNLAENAIKYNRPDGDVWVRLSDHDGEVEICVQDTGIGIPAEAKLRVFERFYRVDKSRSKQIGGTGLGLSIVKHVVEHHVGRMELDSTPGQGTEIRVYLPK